MAYQRYTSLPWRPIRGVVREQELVGATGGRQGIEHHAGGRADRHGARAGLAVGDVDGVLADVALTPRQHLAAAAFNELEQPDGNDGSGHRAWSFSANAR